MLRTHRSSCCHPSSHEGPRHRTSRARPRAGLHRLRESLMTSDPHSPVAAGGGRRVAGGHDTLSARAIFVKTNMKTQRMRNAQAARLGTLEQLFKAMADQTRLRILALLAGGEVCVCDIHETLGIPQPRASRHLAYLRRTGLVLDRKEGLWVYYRLADPNDPVLQTLLSAVVHCLGHVQGSTPDTGAERPGFACCI